MSSREAVLKVLRERPNLKPVLDKIMEWTENHKTCDDYKECTAFEYWNIEGGSEHNMKYLVEAQVIDMLYEGDNHTYYILAEYEGTAKALEEWFEVNGAPEIKCVPAEDDGGIFDCIIGYEDAKELFKMSLGATDPVHVLMISPPASAKSLFLLEMSRLPGAVYILGNSTSKAGLTDFLINHEPKILLIDELDKMSRDDYACLLSLMETGIVSETKYNKTRSCTLKVKVYAACNNVRKLPNEVQSRFLKLHFKPYNEEQFKSTVIGVLTRREHADPKLAEYIANAVWGEVESQDVREAIRLIRLCKTKEDVDKVVAALKNYKQDLVYMGG